MLIFLIVILVLAALLEFLSLRGGTECIDADFSLSKNRCETSDPIELTVTAVNSGRLPISWLTLRIDFPLSAALPADVQVKSDFSQVVVSETFRLWGREKKSRSLSFSVPKRGVHSISGRDVSRGDFLGIRTEEAYFELRRMLLVYPQRLESSALIEALGSYCGELSARRWLIRDPVLTLGVREYTGNEPMKDISWSQTARRGELTVREFDYTRSMNCRVLLCVNGIDDEEEALLDRCCGAARTVCDILIRNGVEAALYTNAALDGYRHEPVRSATASPGREQDVLDILARVLAVPCSTASTLARTAIDAQSETAAFVLIVPHAGADADAAMQILNADSGMGTLLIVVDTLEEEKNG